MCEIEGLTGIQKKSSGIPKILIPYPINNSEKDINAWTGRQNENTIDLEN